MLFYSWPVVVFYSLVLVVNRNMNVSFFFLGGGECGGGVNRNMNVLFERSEAYTPSFCQPFHFCNQILLLTADFFVREKMVAGI